MSPKSMIQQDWMVVLPAYGCQCNKIGWRTSEAHHLLAVTLVLLNSNWIYFLCTCFGQQTLQEWQYKGLLFLVAELYLK